MRQQERLLSFIALALFFVAQTLGAYMARIYAMPQDEVRLLALGFYCTMFAASFYLAFAGRENSRRPGIFFTHARPILLFLAALMLAGQFSATHGKVLPLWLAPACLGALWPVTLLFFFRAFSRARYLLLIGLALAASELIWVVILAIDLPERPDYSFMLLYIHKLQGLIHVLLGLVLALAAGPSGRRHTDSTQAPRKNAPAPHTPSKPVFDAAQWGKTLLLYAVLYYVLFGLATNTGYLRTSGPLSTVDVHLSLLLASPLFGVLLGQGRTGMGGILILLCLAPLASLAEVFGVQSSAIHGLATVGRQAAFFLPLALIGASSLSAARFFLPLCSLMHLMMGLPFLGRWLAAVPLNHTIEGMGATAVALCVTLILLISKIAFTSSIPAHQDASAPGRAEQKPRASRRETPAGTSGLPATTRKVPVRHGSESERQAAFIAAVGLNPREAAIFTAVLNNASLESLSEQHSLSVSAIKYHLRRVLRKTGAVNRRDLREVYAAWLPYEEDE